MKMTFNVFFKLLVTAVVLPFLVGIGHVTGKWLYYICQFVLSSE